MDATMERLVDYTLGTDYDDIAPEVVTACKDRILDTLGCVAAAHGHPVSEAVRTLAARYMMDTPATILGDGTKTAPEMAAFANGVMLRLLDMSDTYRLKSGGHPSDLMAAALAASEIGAHDGKSLITAICIGYEIYCGCCDAIALNVQGWDQPVYGVAASALAAGKLLGLDREQMGNALALALVPNMATYQTRQGELSIWKGCAGANAARNGLFAALLARSGITGPDEAVEGKAGLWNAVGKFDWPVEPGTPPSRIARTALKCFPVCYHGQSAAWTAVELRDKIKPESIEAVEVATHGVAYRMMGNDPTRWAPKTVETADHSLPYVVGTALLRGAVDGSAFTPEALQAPDIAQMMKRITVIEDDEFSAAHPVNDPSRITVRLTDGSEVVHSLPCAKGHERNPMTSAEVQEKFRGLYTKMGSAAAADNVIAAVDGLDTMADIADLIAAFNARG